MGDDMTVKKLNELMPKWNKYLEDAGNPEPGTEKYVELMRMFWYTEGAIDGLNHAKEIYSK